MLAGTSVAVAQTTVPVPQPATSAGREYSAREQENKRVVVAFYNAALNEKNPDEALKYVGPTYRQHNPRAPDGREGLRKFIDQFRATSPQMRVSIRQVFVDGDFVVLNVQAVRPGEPDLAIGEFFRLENGQVVEHWDRIQPVPASANNDNGMF